MQRTRGEGRTATHLWDQRRGGQGAELSTQVDNAGGEAVTSWVLLVTLGGYLERTETECNFMLPEKFLHTVWIRYYLYPHYSTVFNIYSLSKQPK